MTKKKENKRPTVTLTEEEVVNFKPWPPRRRLWDFVPLFITNPLRTRFGIPKATPFERWIIALCVLKSMVERATEEPTPYVHEAPPKKEDPWRWS